MVAVTMKVSETSSEKLATDCHFSPCFARTNVGLLLREMMEVILLDGGLHAIGARQAAIHETLVLERSLVSGDPTPAEADRRRL
jgi:hypothetical protein